MSTVSITIMLTDHVKLEDVINNVKFTRPAQDEDPRLDVSGVFCVKTTFCSSAQPDLLDALLKCNKTSPLEGDLQ